MARPVYLVGSVPMASAEEVFTRVGGALGPYLKWLPDGETGQRLDWITWLEPIFAGNPALTPSGTTFRVHDGADPHTRYRLKPGLSAADVVLDNLLYADTAIASYAVFARLKRTGVIPAHVKFQVDLVPAHSVLWLYIDDDLQAALDPIYNAAVKREIDKIAAAIPASELAIQLDVASAVFARLQRGAASSYGSDKPQMQQRFGEILIDLADHVPASVDLLFHFCYGDANHKHVVEPEDMTDMVELANRLAERIARPIQMIHMPVPRNRFDDAYFAPLQRLQMDPKTLLVLGLVHHTDGLAGTQRRMTVAARFRSDFGIGTECGFGRRPRDTIGELIDIHAMAAVL